MQSTQTDTRFARVVRAWTAGVQRRAAWVVAAAVLAGAGLAWYAATHLSIDTDTANMLSAKLPWRQAEKQMDRLFPALDSGIAVVIDGATPELADDAQGRLVEALRAEPQLFLSVFAAETEPYFRQNGVLYLDTDAVQKMADALNQAQPFLGTLTADPSLHGLFTLLNRAVSASDTAGIDLSPVFAKLAEGVDDAAAGKFSPLSWQDMMGQQNAAGGDPTRRFIDVKPSLDFSRMLAAGSAIAEIRAQAAKLGLDEAHGVRVRLTGSRVLEQEEIQSALGGGLRALSAALVMVAVLLFLALRSARLVIAAVATLAAGLLVTAAFAAAVVGQLNLISIAFSVLYVGLGIDYALYLCMQYRELIGTGVPPREALPRAAGDVAGFMLVCACTTSLGFFAFVPTSFTGIASLGLISGVGMFISLAMSLSVLPAFISLLPPDPARVVLRPPGGSSPVLDWPYKHARLIWIGAAVLAAGAAWLAPRAYFDYDPLDLRDPKSESVATFRDLLKDPNVPALSLAVVTDSPEQAKALEDKLSKLPLVAHAISLPDLVPQDQDAKLGIISDLNLSVGPTFASHPGPMKITVNDDDYAAIDQLHGALPAYLAKTSGPTQQAAQSLLKALDGLEQSWSQGDSAAHETLLARLRQVLLGTLPAQVDTLQTALQARPVSEQDLPPQLAQRWKSTDDTGHTWYRVEIWPKEVLDTPAAMERFVAQVRTVAPNAVGPPVGYIESGHSVVGAFRQAFACSFIAITILLLVLLRSLVDALFVLIPLSLAGLLTVAGSVLLKVPFNFANVIALPLILGVGVDYGVYLVQRGRAAAAARTNLLRTGTARAVLYGALITTANFGNLMLAKHPGTVSMGVILTVGLSMTLICALVLLPSLLAKRYGGPD